MSILIQYLKEQFSSSLKYNKTNYIFLLEQGLEGKLFNNIITSILSL